MAKYVKISTIGAAPFNPQPPIHGQAAVDAMIAHWKGRLGQVLPEEPDLIVVPEACDRYGAHSMQERQAYYRVRKTQVRDFFAQIAREHRCYIAYSAAREMEDGTWRNSTQLIDRTGEVAGIYSKVHPTVGEIDDGGILCGKGPVIVECDFGRVGAAICFDLNFHELLEAYKTARPDLIVFSSMYHGGLMQAYWAYHCRAHFVGAIAGNRSCIISPVGQILATSTNYFDYVTATVNLDCRVVHLDYNRPRLARLKETYGPAARVFDPGNLGCVLLASESDKITADQLIAEFEIELWDDYYARALKHQHDPKHIERE
ncbi:MAG: carbon-nitrogen hydrolase family protein [Kiritimatiellae bacterium]|nr:carbon-nitrogen hydrolase family protein [Kiritimatiellia bacterium]